MSERGLGKYSQSWSDNRVPVATLEQLAVAEHYSNQESGRFIEKDDILNLRITLETTTVDQFLAVI